MVIVINKKTEEKIKEGRGLEEMIVEIAGDMIREDLIVLENAEGVVLSRFERTSKWVLKSEKK